MNYIDFLKLSKQLFVILNYRGIITHTSFGFQAVLPPTLQILTGTPFSHIVSEKDKKKFKQLFKISLSEETILYTALEFNFSNDSYIVATTKESPDEILLCISPITPSQIQSNIASMPLQTIVIADDNRVNQLLMQGMLQKMGHKVIVATNGKEALDIIQHNDVSIFFTDCEMPIMDGFVTAQTLREMGHEIPIIAVSGNNDAHTKNRCFKAGMSGFLTKPINEVQLKKALYKWALKKHIV